MSKKSFSAAEVAQFLSENRSFLVDHADVFADLSVPHPYEEGVLSIADRQLLALRTKVKELQWHLSELLYCADENKDINDSITYWCANLLAQKDAHAIPHQLVDSLDTLFPDLEVQLRVWNLPSLQEHEYLVGEPHIIDYVQSLSKPYCGTEGDDSVRAWLSRKAGSVAIIPLRYQDITLGALVFGSENPEHFSEDMGLVFLHTIGELAAAALRRLQ